MPTRGRADPEIGTALASDPGMQDIDRVEDGSIAQTGTAFTTYEDEGDEVCAWLEARVRAWRCAHLTKSGM